MQSVSCAIITKLIASKKYYVKRSFVIILAAYPYILNQDISKWHFFHRSVPSRRRLPCLDGTLPVQMVLSLERAVRIDVSSANCRAKSHFRVRTAERNPIFRCPPLGPPETPLGPPETPGGREDRLQRNHFQSFSKNK